MDVYHAAHMACTCMFVSRAMVQISVFRRLRLHLEFRIAISCAALDWLSARACSSTEAL